jgi:hypothetical protein
VYCQGFHRYEVNSEAIALVFETFAKAFDHVAVWSTNRADLMMLGFRDADLALDVDRLRVRAQRSDFRAVLDRLGIPDLPTLLAHEAIPLGVLHAAARGAPIHSLYHPRLNFEAGRAFFAGHQGNLPFTGYGKPAGVGAVNALLRRYIDRSDGQSPEAIYAKVAPHTCLNYLPGCGAYVAAWAQSNPQSEEFRSLVAAMQNQRGPRFIRRMLALRGGPVEISQPRIPPNAAIEVTRLFFDEYAHGAPLDPRALRGFWERCGVQPAGVERCRPGLQAAQHLLNGEAPPDPKDWLKPASEGAPAARHAAPGAQPDEGADAEE